MLFRIAFLCIALAASSAYAATPVSKPLRFATRIVEICPGVYADSAGFIGVSREIQLCLDGAASSPWTIPPGEYLIDAALSIERPIEISARNVTFRAHRNITGTGAGHTMVFAGYMAGISITGLTLDGNLAQRQGAAFCNGTTDAYAGGNIHFDHVDDVVLDGITTRNAVCGSGMHFSGKRAKIVNSTFANNGLHTSNHWADGLTLLNCDGCLVTGNRFVDNSDVGLVFGGGEHSLISDNRFEQSTPIFAALALDNFNGSQSGNFVGTRVTGNTIDCGNLQCDFGMNLGPRAWYLSPNVRGGIVTGNTVRGAKIGVLAGGAGTRDDPMTLHGNTVVQPQAPGASAQFSCGLRPTYPLIISPTSVVDTQGDVGAVGASHELCP